MKKLATVLLLAVLGCHRQPASTAPSGADSGRQAVERFLTTARAPDYDGMGAVWGTVQGSARTTMNRSQMEQRLFVMMKCLRHDRFQVLSETPTPAGERSYVVQLAHRTVTASSNFVAVMGPGGRWYVREFKPEDLQAICTSI